MVKLPSIPPTVSTGPGVPNMGPAPTFGPAPKVSFPKEVIEIEDKELRRNLVKAITAIDRGSRKGMEELASEGKKDIEKRLEKFNHTRRKESFAGLSVGPEQTLRGGVRREILQKSMAGKALELKIPRRRHPNAPPGKRWFISKQTSQRARKWLNEKGLEFAWVREDSQIGPSNKNRPMKDSFDELLSKRFASTIGKKVWNELVRTT